MKINKEKLKQFLLDNSDCYADTWIINPDENTAKEGAVIPAITVETATKLIIEYCINQKIKS